jgi:DNA-binding HxlR family transcriptional regulator
VTKAKRSAPRWYEDACGAAHALELLGERWALLVARELMFGPRRFGELRQGLPGISANVLTQRLEGLEAAGVLTRRPLAFPASGQVYELTPWGYELEPVFRALGRWAARSPAHDPTLPLSAASLLLSFGALLERKRAENFEGSLGLQLGDDTFVVSVLQGELSIRRGALDRVAASLSGSPQALAAVIYGGRSWSAAEGDGSVRVAGDRALAKRFVTLFRLPPKVG